MSKTIDGEMSFLEHLEVMRWHLLRSLLAIVVMALVAFVFKGIVFDTIILAPKEPNFPTNRWLCELGEILGLQRICINQDPFSLQTVKMAEQFSIHIIVSLVAGLVIAFPYVFWEIWRFVMPALYDKERSSARGAVFYVSLLFSLGVLFGYYIISPLSVNFLGNYKVSESVISAPTLRSYVQTVTSVVLSAGLVFQLPILVYFLSKAGLVTPDFLKKYRRHALILIVTLSAIITPPDVFSQVLVALPLMLLYEIGINISRRIMKQQEAADLAASKPAKKAKKKDPDEGPEQDSDSSSDSSTEPDPETDPDVDPDTDPDPETDPDPSPEKNTSEEPEEAEAETKIEPDIPSETDPQPDPRTADREEQSTKKPWKQKASKKDKDS